MDKFKNKYRLSSARLKNWDYGNNGSYFITICTKNREDFFGEIIDGIMHLNEIGLLAEKYWLEIPFHFPFITLGNFIVMPNHIHGILILDKNGVCGVSGVGGVSDVSNVSNVETLQCNVSTNKPTDIKNPTVTIINKNIEMSNISPKSGSISTIIRSYKSVVSKIAHLINPTFGWQPRFHDHIIRDSNSFENIQTYIENNARNWEKDKFYSGKKNKR